MSLIVSGAYGRDYKSAKAAKADWNAEKDFIIRTKKQRLSRNGQKVEILVNMLKPRQKG